MHYLYKTMSKQNVQEVRAFNRFYTDIIGLLNQHLLNSAYSLAEARIIYELFQHKSCQASDIMSIMEIDKSYLSRLLKKLEKEKVVAKTRSETDARAISLCLTKKGMDVFEGLNRASNEQVTALLSPLSGTQKEELVRHMKAVTDLLTPAKIKRDGKGY